MVRGVGASSDDDRLCASCSVMLLPDSVMLLPGSVMVASRKVTSFAVKMMQHAIDGKCHERHCRVASIDRLECVRPTVRRQRHCSVVRDLTDQDLKDLDRRVRSRQGQGRSSPYARRSKADDVGRSIPTDVGQLARVGVVAAPAAGIGTKGRELECRRCEVPASGG
jgi:hypothetical protein